MKQKCIVVTNPMIAANRSAEVTLSKFLRVMKANFSDIAVIGGNLRVEPDLADDVELVSFDIVRSDSKFKRIADIFCLQYKMHKKLLSMVDNGMPVFFWLADKMLLPYWAVKQKFGLIYYFIYGNTAKEGNPRLFTLLSANLIRYMAKHAYSLCIESPSVISEWPSLKSQNSKTLHLYVDSVGLNPMNKREPVLGMVCRLAEGKHVLECISAMQSIHEEYPQWRLEIIGSGRQKEECENLIRKLDAKSYVSLLGWVEHEQVVQRCETWSWLLFPTDTEGLPNGLLEMMGRGIPALTSPVGGIADLIQDGDNGFFFQDTTQDGITQGILKILSLDKNEYERCCNGAYMRIASSYTLAGATENAKAELEQ